MKVTLREILMLLIQHYLLLILVVQRLLFDIISFPQPFLMVYRIFLSHMMELRIPMCMILKTYTAQSMIRLRIHGAVVTMVSLIFKFLRWKPLLQRLDSESKHQFNLFLTIRVLHQCLVAPDGLCLS